MGMKRYIKDGEIWDGISIVLGDSRIWNPSEEQLTEAGYKEYVKPEPTLEELIAEAKAEKIAAIEEYDVSAAVNEFTLNGVAMWCDDAERTKLAKRFDTDEEDGFSITKLIYDNVAYVLPIAQARGMLHRLESYARDCFDKTNEHKLNVANLTTLEEIENYDYTKGYPGKLEFAIDGLS